MTKDINSILVQSCYIEEYKSGIISVLFDTKKRWLEYGRGNEQTYWFRDNSIEFLPNNSSANIDTISIPPFLPDKSFICYHMQEKDQVEYLYIPMDLLE